MRIWSLAAMGGSPPPSGTTFLVNENCEGVGTGTGWVNEGANMNWDYTAVPLADAQSLYMTMASTAARVRIDFADQTEAYAYFLFRITNGSAPAANRTIGGMAANGNTAVAPAFILATTLRLQLAASCSPANAISLDTTYHVWWHYKQGTGADAVIDLGFSTNGVRPTSGGNYAQITNGTQTNLWGRLYLGNTLITTNVDIIFDNIRVAATQIGDNGA